MITLSTFLSWTVTFWLIQKSKQVQQNILHIHQLILKKMELVHLLLTNGLEHFHLFVSAEG